MELRKSEKFPINQSSFWSFKNNFFNDYKFFQLKFLCFCVAICVFTYLMLYSSTRALFFIYDYIFVFFSECFRSFMCSGSEIFFFLLLLFKCCVIAENLNIKLLNINLVFLLFFFPASAKFFFFVLFL